MITTEKGFKIPEEEDFYSIEYIKNNIPLLEKIIDSILENKLNKLDIANNLTTATAGKVLDAMQGKVLKDLVDGKAPKSHVDVVGNGSDLGHVKLSDTYKSKIEDGGAENGLAASQNALYNAFSEINADLGGLTFCQNEEGNWGYKPSGADSVIPFKDGGSYALTVNVLASGYSKNSSGDVTYGMSCTGNAVYELIDGELTKKSHSYGSGTSTRGKISIASISVSVTEIE